MWCCHMTNATYVTLTLSSQCLLPHWVQVRWVVMAMYCPLPHTQSHWVELLVQWKYCEAILLPKYIDVAQRHFEYHTSTPRPSGLLLTCYWYRFHGMVFFAHVLTFTGDQCHLEGSRNHSPSGEQCPPYLYEICRWPLPSHWQHDACYKIEFSPTVRMQVKYGFPCLWESWPPASTLSFAHAGEIELRHR